MDCTRFFGGLMDILRNFFGFKGILHIFFLVDLRYFTQLFSLDLTDCTQFFGGLNRFYTVFFGGFKDILHDRRFLGIQQNFKQFFGGFKGIIHNYFLWI